MTVHIGDTLKDRYKVEESLGRGGMADVYKVWDEERSTYLALKLLRDDLAQDPVFMRRFRREAHNLAQLQHPNIVRFYGLEEDDLKAFILMEYIEGPTLREEIRRAGSGGLALERVQSIMEGVCSALQYAHNKGLVHCDIKSGNILIDASGKAYLTDFGIARGMDAATSTMVGIGTPAYMAPELIKGEDPTPQTDIYALGIVLYEMLTGGERPFTGERAEITGTTAEKVRWEHLNMRPTPVAKLNSSTAASFETIIGKCLEKNACDRYASVLDLIDSITALTVKDLSDLNDQEQAKGKYSDVELNREKKDTVEYREEKEKTGGDRTGWVVGILMICIGILSLTGNYRTSTQNKRITVIEPTNVQSTSDLKQATLPIITLQNQINESGFNGTENWECVYKIKQGDSIGYIYHRFNIEFSPEEKIYLYQNCYTIKNSDSDKSSLVCVGEGTVDNNLLIYPDTWLIIDSPKENSLDLNTERCINSGGNIHILSDEEGREIISSENLDPIKTDQYKKIVKSNINEIEEINTKKLINSPILEIVLTDNEDSFWILFKENGSLDYADFESYFLASLDSLEIINVPAGYEDEEEIALSSRYHIFDRTIYYNSDLNSVFEIPEGNEIIGFSSDNSRLLTYYRIQHLGNVTEYWKVKVWDMENKKNICNTPELSTFDYTGFTYLINEGENFVTVETEILDSYDMNTKSYVTLWDTDQCRKVDTITFDGFLHRSDTLYSLGDVLLWHIGITNDDDKIVQIHDDHLITVEASLLGMNYDEPYHIKTVTLPEAGIIVFAYENKIEFRDLQTLSLIDSFSIDKEISSIASNSEETLLLIGTSDGTIIQYGILQ